MSTEIEKGGSQVIARAASILKALEGKKTGLSITELARLTGLPRTTTHRLVVSLETQQLVIHHEDGVRLGPALARLAASAHTDIIALSKPAIETLGRRTRETVDLCVYRGSHAISVSQFVSDQELRVVSPIGTAFPIHCTAHGKAMLAQLDTDLLDKLMISNSDVRTPNTLISTTALAQHLVEIRHQGYAIDREEHALGVCGLGVSLKTHLNEGYAISLAVPSLRFDSQFDHLLTSLLQCKAEIESLLS